MTADQARCARRWLTQNDGDTIDATGVSGAILLTSGELQINRNVTINGPGAGNLAVNGRSASRIFENFASDVTISGFTITNGHPPPPHNNGGGIFNHGGLTLNESSVTSSAAEPNHGSGGGIFVDSGGTLTVTNSTISGNEACCVSAYGGGIYSLGATVEVIDSTISGNSADTRGGGIGGGGQITVTNSTISGNEIFLLGGQLTIGDTILNGEGGGTISVFHNATVTSLGYNLASDNGGGFLIGPGDQINTDPMLGPLQDNGGPTFTHELLPGSPAIDAGGPELYAAPVLRSAWTGLFSCQERSHRHRLL